ncbi:MAG: TrbC family F-type conjugative pilus assembly protein, partial [Pseudomonadales bacterium]|nr:TrbC family F-type conjugative pilus assembly protein [Pseudomonadales bacterium]
MPGWQSGQELGAEAGEVARRQVLSRQHDACRDLGGDCTLPDDLAAPGQAETAPVVTILVSRSLGDGALRQIFASASGKDDIRILFRGVREGESLGDFLRATAVLLRDLDPPPNVAIDPQPFREWRIERVPAVVLSGPDGEIARVAGLSSPNWLREQVEGGRTGDLGQRGPTMEIEEPDMIAEIHRRIAAIDWQARKEQAIARWWSRARFEHLSPATEARERIV